LAADAHNAIVRALVAEGTTQAWLRVFEDNHRARRFYEKLDWQSTGQRSATSFPPHPVLLTYERAIR
jgi:RimJ/RimL family protein N-acetyltransferase